MGVKERSVGFKFSSIRGLLKVNPSLRIQLYTLIVLLSLLLLGSISATAISIWDHIGEEAQVEIVHHQRTLLLQMAWLVLDGPTVNVDLENLIIASERNLSALKNGGVGVTHEGVDVEIQPPETEPMQEQLDEISKTWIAYRSQLAELITLSDGDPSREQRTEFVQNQYFLLIQQYDEFIAILERHMANDHDQLIVVQSVYLLIAVPLVIWGGDIIRRRIIRPLLTLQDAAIRFGNGDLSIRVQPQKEDEMGDLANAFEKMRSEIFKNKTQLENQVAVRTHELSVAFEFSQEIVGQLDFESLLAMITKKASALMRAERAFLCLANPRDNTVEMYADISGVRKGNKPQQKAELVQEVAIDGKAVVAMVPDYACKFIQAESSKQCISVPLRSGDRIIGAICALRVRSDVIDENEKQAFVLLANSAAVAIENVRLINTQEQQARQNAVSLERQRLASELHDNLIQMLNLINLRIGQIQGSLDEYHGRDFQSEFDFVKSNVTVAIDQVRMMMGDIVSPYQGESNMVSRVEKDIRAFEEKTGLIVDVTGTGTFLDRLAPLSQKQLLMILTEALTNIQRHADAERTMVLFEEDQDKVLMTVEDNGRGFQTDLDHGNHHYGLRIMRTRAERSGGSLNVESKPGQGTRIIVSFPFAVQE